MNPPVTSGEGFPLRTQVNRTHQTAMTMAELCEAWNNFRPQWPITICDFIAGELDGTFRTRDNGRTGYFYCSIENTGRPISECHWAANDGSEFGGFFDGWELEADLLRPTRKRIEYCIVGNEGFEISQRERAIDGRRCVETHIRRIRMLQRPSVTDGTYHKPIISAIPVLLDPQQDTFTYDPNGGGTRWRLERDTFGFTQDGITGTVKTNFGSGTYNVGEGVERRRVAWEDYAVNGEPLTRFRTHYIHGGGMREAELPRGSKPENDGFGGDSDESDSRPNFTGRVLISVDPVAPNMA
jgi:hypothetical protein